MPKTLIGPQLRQLRRERNQTQAEMAQVLGVSTAYVNLLENNQRSLSVKMLMSLSSAYGVDWRDLMKDDSSNRLASLRTVTRDPVFGGNSPDIQELRAAIDHAPKLVDQFMSLYRSHRAAIEKMMQVGSERMPNDLLRSSPEATSRTFTRPAAHSSGATKMTRRAPRRSACFNTHFSFFGSSTTSTERPAARSR